MCVCVWDGRAAYCGDIVGTEMDGAAHPASGTRVAAHCGHSGDMVGTDCEELLL